MIEPVDLEAFRKRLGLKIYKANEPTLEWGICMALYGSPGVGKTTFLGDAEDSPFGNPLCIVDGEGGTRSIAHRHCDIIPVTSWKEIKAFTDYVIAMPEPPWRTIGFDNMSEYLSMCLGSIVTPGNLIEQQHWNKSTNEMLSFTRKWRDYARSRAVNVIFIAWEAPEKEEGSSVIKRDLGFNPALARQLPGIVDWVGYMTVRNNGQRVISFAPSTRTAAKFRRSKTETARKVPLEIIFGEDEKPMVDLLNVLRGGQDWPTEKYTKANRSQPTDEK